MTVESDSNSKPYVASGSSATFAYPFYIIASTDLKVYKNGVLITPGNYTVTNVGNENGGNVVFNVIPAAGTAVLLRREVPFTQKIDLKNNAEEPSENIEQALDRAVMLAQQLDEDLALTIKLPITTVLTDIEFPDGTANPLKYIRWNAAGTALEAVSAIITGTVSFSANGETLVGLNFAAMKTALGASSVGGGEVYAESLTGSDAYAVTVDSSITSYTDGLTIRFKADVTNTNVSSLNVNGLGAIPIIKNGTIPTVTRDIMAGQVVEVIYAGGSFHMVSPALPMIRDGSIVLENTYQYAALDNASVIRNLLFLDSGNIANIGSLVNEMWIQANLIKIPNNVAFQGKESGGTGRSLIYITNANVISLGDPANALHTFGLSAAPLYNTYTMWHSGNDGAASGLDSDLLDGKQGSVYLAKDETGAVTLAVSQLNLANNVFYRALNTSASSDELLGLDGSNIVQVGNTGRTFNIRTPGAGYLKHNSVNVIDAKSEQIVQARGRITSTGGITDDNNISSITKNGTGDYTCVFTTAMGDANYSPMVIGLDSFANISSSTAPTVNAFRYVTADSGGSGVDKDHWIMVSGLPS